MMEWNKLFDVLKQAKQWPACKAAHTRMLELQVRGEPNHLLSGHGFSVPLQGISRSTYHAHPEKRKAYMPEAPCRLRCVVG